MQTIAPIISASRLYAEPSQPTSRKTPQVAMRTPIVMPESGQEEEPTSPVMREDTTEKRKPRSRIRMAPITFIWNAGTATMNTTIRRAPIPSTATGVSRSVRETVAPPSPPPISPFAEAPIEDTIEGSARASAKIPPAATAPAPMCLT
jgi:hypothetical protein